MHVYLPQIDLFQSNEDQKLFSLLIFPPQRTLFILYVLPSLISRCLWMLSFHIDPVSHFVHSMYGLYIMFYLVSHHECILQVSKSVIVFYFHYVSFSSYFFWNPSFPFLFHTSIRLILARFNKNNCLLAHF